MMDGWVDKVDLGGGEDTKNYDEIMATKRCKPKLFFVPLRIFANEN